jgi:AcrR family transcriptional regulator
MTTTAAPTPIAAPVARPLRGDAARNRARVLAAAWEVFSAEGADAQMEQIAKRAGVGVGTLYRNFPTKQALLAELGRQFLDERIAMVEQAIAAPDPVPAFEHFLRRTAEDMATNAGLCHVLGDLQVDQVCPGEFLPLRHRTAVLLDRVRPTGAIRPDLTIDDFQAIMVGLSAAMGSTSNWELFADMIIAGMRAQTR